MVKPNKMTFLLVDDDKQERMFIKRQLSKSGFEMAKFFEARDGSEALAILKGDEGEKLISQPYIILLDLNMPVMNGIEFLEELRSDEKLKQAIVFVLSTSRADEDKCNSYNYNVAGYIVKDDNDDKEDISVKSLLINYIDLIQFPL